MRQILMNMSGVVVARMPRPTVQRGTVLIRVRYSLVSVGTEVAPLRPASVSAPDVARSTADSSARGWPDTTSAPACAIRARRRGGCRRWRSIGCRALRQASCPGARPADAPAVSDLNAQGWAIGYSAAGEVVAVGDGVTDLAAGDLVAAAGAGQANHADYVNVPRNLVCRIPAGCDLKQAASATIGAIALQGVRRAAPQLGERVCVVGLGLIGQITVQLLKAAGCRVIGLDLDPQRVAARARARPRMPARATPTRSKQLVRDLTERSSARTAR